MSVDYAIRGTPQANRLPVPNEAALAYDFVNNILWGSSPDTGSWVDIGGGPSGGPIIEASLNAINTLVPSGLSIVAPGTQLYALSIYMKALGTGGAGTTYTKTLSYTAADGSGVQTITLILPLDSSNVVMETYPLFALGGTILSAIGVFSGAPSPFTISERIVQMPGGAV